jgi:hypothetical protein
MQWGHTVQNRAQPWPAGLHCAGFRRHSSLVEDWAAASFFVACECDRLRVFRMYREPEWKHHTSTINLTIIVTFNCGVAHIEYYRVCFLAGLLK